MSSYGKLDEDKGETAKQSVEEPSVPWRLVWQIYLVTTADGTALGLAIPFLPAMCRGFFGDDDEAIGRGVGLLTGCFLLCNFFSSFAIGHFSDRFGRKPLLLIGLLAVCDCV